MKLNNENFERFKDFCKEYQEIFHLSEWNIEFEFKSLKDSRAQSAFDLEASNCTIALNTEWDESVVKFTDKALRGIAKHEVLHVLLGRLGCLAQYRYVTSRELDSAEHAIIQKLLVLIP